MKYGLHKTTIEMIRGVFARFPEVERAVLYGSRAKGTYQAGSDIDLTLYGDALTPDLRDRIANALDDLLLPYTIDLSLFDELDHTKLREHIERVGVVFYERVSQGVGKDARWQTKKLVDVCHEITDGSHFSPKTCDVGYPYITVRDIDNDRIDFNNCRFINEADFNQLVKNGCQPHLGDVLFSKDGTVGKVALVDSEKNFVVLSSLAIIRPDNRIINSSFLKYAMTSPSFLDEAIGKKTGVAIRRIILRNLKSIFIPLPPLPEQKRIVSILDETFAGIATATANAKKNLANARELFESELQSVFTKKNDKWVTDKLVSLTTKIGSGATPLGGETSYKDNGISLIRSLNVYDRNFRYEKLAFIDNDQADRLSNVTIQSKDVLLNITGASVARCCVVPDNVLPARVNQHVSIIRTVANKLNSEFLQYALTSKPYKDNLLKTGEDGGATRQAITKAQLQEFEIIYPELIEDQLSIVSQLNELSAETKRLEVIYHKKLNALDELKKSILNQAFSGQLH